MGEIWNVKCKEAGSKLIKIFADATMEGIQNKEKYEKKQVESFLPRVIKSSGVFDECPKTLITNPAFSEIWDQFHIYMTLF